jgi:hypothetical protein
MTHRDYVLAAIRHEQTDRVPYSLGFEDGTDNELDAYCGSVEWRKKVQCFLRGVGGVDANVEQSIDAGAQARHLRVDLARGPAALASGAAGDGRAADGCHHVADA